MLDKKLINIYYSILGLIFITMSLYPYWYFGDYSMLGWHDEIDGRIPWSYITNNNSKTDFIHAWAGGSLSVFGFGIEEISFLRFLKSNFSLLEANFIIRFLNMTFYLLGIYLLLKNLFKSSPTFILFSASLYSLFVCQIPYGWTMGGMGWDITITIWLTLSLVGKFGSIKINYILGLITILVGATISHPLFLFYMLFIFTIICVLFFKNLKEFTKQYLYMWLFFCLVTPFVFIANWTELYYPIFGAKDFSTRYLNVLTKPDISGDFLQILLFNIQKSYKEFIYSSDYSQLKLLYIPIYILIVFLAFYKLQIFRTLTLFIFFIFGIILFQSFSIALNIPFFNTYRWTLIWILMPIILSLCVVYLINVESNWNKNIYKYFNLLNYPILIITSGLLIYYSYKGGYFLSFYSVHKMNSKNTIKSVTYYNDLKKLNHDNYRVVTDYSTLSWTTPLYYDMDTFDGMQSSFSERRTYFMAYGLSIIEKDVYPKNHLLSFSENEIEQNKNMLEMANVKYILTSKNNIKITNNKILSIKGRKFLDEFDDKEYINKLILQKFQNINIVKPLNVFELDNPWPRIFISKNIRKSSYSYKSKEFYRELKEISYLDSIISLEDNIKYESKVSDIIIESFKKTNKGMRININKGKGYITYNQVYNPYWQAYCDNKKLDIIPTNGIMMTVYADAGCKNLEFIHEMEIK